MNGEVWKAVSDEKISEGEEVEITDIEGVKLKVKKNQLNNIHLIIINSFRR